jgi:hemoglobin/transferrin/lactoferrin receptor protein
MTAGYNSVNSGSVLSGTYAAQTDAVAAMVQATLRDAEERNVGFSDPLDEKSRNVLARIDFGDALAGGIGLTFEQFSADSVTEVDSLEGSQDFTSAFGFPYLVDTTVVRADDRRERMRASVGQEWLAGKFGTSYLRWRAYYQSSNTTQDTFEARDTLIAGAPGAVERNRRFEFDQSMYGIEINAASMFTTGRIQHQLAYGVEFEQADTEQLRSGTETDLLTSVTSNRVGPDLYPLRDFPVSTTRRSGIYIEDHISLGAFTLLPGVRWDRYQLTPEPDDIFTSANPGLAAASYDDDQFSPKLGLLWQLTDETQLYAQYAEGFRAPPVNDVNVGFRNVQFGYTALPNPDLESESSQGYELGFRYAGRNARWDLSAFTTRYDNFIQSLQVVGFDPIDQLLLFQSVNVDRVEIRGAEFSASITPAFLAEGWRIDAAIAYAEGEDRLTGQPINTVAPLNGVLGVAFDHSSDRWGASFITRGAEQQDNLDESEGELLSPEGFIVFDALAYWRPSDSTRLRAGVYNLADEAYTSFLDVQGVPADTPFPERFQRPGREISVAFDWTF